MLRSAIFCNRLICILDSGSGAYVIKLCDTILRCMNCNQCFPSEHRLRRSLGIGFHEQLPYLSACAAQRDAG